MRQASRRSWRIGQTRPVKVVFMSYRNTLQADALKLVAKKLQSSLAVEGELPEDGLAAYGDDGDDLMMALARRIVSGDEEDEAETVEEVFAQARTPRPPPRSCWWTTAGRTSRSIRKRSRSTGMVTARQRPPRRRYRADGRACPGQRSRQRSTETATTACPGQLDTGTRPRSRSSRCSPGRSSWPRSRSSPGTGPEAPARRPRPCSIGRSA